MNFDWLVLPRQLRVLCRAFGTSQTGWLIEALRFITLAQFQVQ